MNFIHAIIQLLGGQLVYGAQAAPVSRPRHYEGDNVLTVKTDNGPIYPTRPY
jgi:hypothetical protein